MKNDMPAANKSRVISDRKGMKLLLFALSAKSNIIFSQRALRL